MGCIWGQRANPPATEPSNAAPERSPNPKTVKAAPLSLPAEWLRDVPIEVEDSSFKAPPRHVLPPLRKPPPPMLAKPKLPVKAPPLPVLAEWLGGVPIEVEDPPFKAPPRHVAPPLRKPPPPKPAGVQG